MQFCIQTQVGFVYKLFCNSMRYHPKLPEFRFVNDRLSTMFPLLSLL